MCDLAGELLESNVLLLQAILIAGFRARNIDAASEAVELPGVEYARHMVGVAGRLRYRQGPEVERIGQLGFVNGHEPHFLPDLLELLLENTLVAVDSAVDIRNRLAAVVGDLVPLRRHVNLRCVGPPHAIAAPPFRKS